MTAAPEFAMRSARPVQGRERGCVSELIADQAVLALLREVAAWPKPGLVSRVDSGSHTDMDAAYASRAGIATGLISLATRYIHTPTEVVSLDDVDAAIRLVAAFAARLEPGFDFAR